jgi:ElaB/YqjD/DUF883 family membrane-anchored ribosome-binding protein
MDEKHSNQAPRPSSAPKSVQAQPQRADARDTSSNAADAANARGEQSAGTASLSKPEASTQSGSLTAVLQASRVELDRLLAETQTIHERSWGVIHSLLEKSQLKALQAVDAGLAHFEDEIQERIRSHMTMMLQNFDVEAGSRLTARLDQGLATARQRQRSIEQDLAVAVAENRKQLDQISTGAAEGLRLKGQGLLGDLEREAERHVTELAKNARQITENIQQLADNFGAELKRSTEEAIQVFRSRIEQTWQEMMGQADQRITDTTNAYVVELAKQARHVVNREMSEFLSHALRQFDPSSNGPASNKSS